MSIKVVCCGMQAKKMADVANREGQGAVTATVLSDLQGAQGILAGKFDYYLGTCQTGGGGSLGMAVALLGPQKAKVLGTPGRPPAPNDALDAVKAGVKAFGFPYDQIDGVVPIIIKILISHHGEGK